MKLTELQEWIKSSRYVDTVEIECDESGNTWYEKIYERDGKLYQVSFFNDHPNNVYFEGMRLNDEKRYSVKEVVKKTVMVEHTFYEEI